MCIAQVRGCRLAARLALSCPVLSLFLRLESAVKLVSTWAPSRRETGLQSLGNADPRQLRAGGRACVPEGEERIGDGTEPSWKRPLEAQCVDSVVLPAENGSIKEGLCTPDICRVVLTS